MLTILSLHLCTTFTVMQPFYISGNYTAANIKRAVIVWPGKVSSHELNDRTVRGLKVDDHAVCPHLPAARLLEVHQLDP